MNQPQPPANTPAKPQEPDRASSDRPSRDRPPYAGHVPLAQPASPPPKPVQIVPSVTRAKKSLALSDEQLLAECDRSFYIAGGPGGQHRNKTESAVRLVHRPTGIVCQATERRSQHENQIHALARLREKLAIMSFVPKKRKATKATRGSIERRLKEKKHSSQKKHNRNARGD